MKLFISFYGFTMEEFETLLRNACTSIESELAKMLNTECSIEHATQDYTTSSRYFHICFDIKMI